MSSIGSPIVSDSARPWDLRDFAPPARPSTRASDPPAKQTAKDVATSLERLAELAAERERARLQGHAQGLAEGRADARAEIDAAVATARAQISQIASSLKAEMERLDDVISDDVLRFALDLARAMTHQTYQLHPEAVRENVAACLRVLPAIADAVIQVHPDDLELVRGCEPAVPNATYHPDPGLKRGECFVSTKSSAVDGRHGQRWDLLMATLGQESTWITNG